MADTDISHNASAAIIIAAYNASATVARAVRSALLEPEVSEVVVVDDASTDNTVTVARAQDDGSGRLSVLCQPSNAGPSAARNRAIKESQASWIGILDADDFILPGRMTALLAYKEQADFIADDLWQVAENDPYGLKRSLYGSVLNEPMAIDFETFVLSNVTRGTRKRGELGFLKPLMRRSFLELHGLHYQEHMRLGEDFELYARALGHGARLLLVPPQGYISVWREHSLSGNHSEADLLYLRDCDKALEASLNLTKAQTCALRSHYSSVDCRLQWRRLIAAVKQRDPAAMAHTFLRPYPVPFYLLRQLLHQLYLRTFKIKAGKP